ncbi:hypothetical protein LSAT2_027683, partial [Lamellibrachia satsuma]
TMATLSSTVTSFLEEVVTASDSTDDFSGSFFRPDLSAYIWRWVWPLLCLTGLVGNTLVLLVLRRDGLVRTSANVYLTALAVGDSLVLVVAYRLGVLARRYECMGMSHHQATTQHITKRVCLDHSRVHCRAIRFPLLKRRVCTPSNAGLCCVALFVTAFVKNADFVFMSDFTANSSVDINCFIQSSYRKYVYKYRAWINIVLNAALPLCTIVACNLAIIRQLRRRLMPAAVRDSLTRTTLMCLGVSFAFIVCVVPLNAFFIIERYYQMKSPYWDVVRGCLFLLRYVNHAINFFLYNLTGAHFRSELIALVRSCIRRGRATAAAAVSAVVRRLPSRDDLRFFFQQSIGDDIEMR